MFCKHKWSVLSEITSESKIQHMESLGMSFHTRDEGVMREYVSQKLVLVVSCDKCGKLKKFVEKL